MSNNETTKNLKSLVILIGLLVLCFASGYYFKSKEPAPVVNETTSKSDTIYMIDTTKHSEVHNHFHVTNSYTVAPDPATVDTAKILKDYFTKKFVADTIVDSLLQFAIYDTLYNNTVVNRKTSYMLLKPYQTVISTTVTTIPPQVSQKGFYVGAFFGFNKSFIQAAGVEANLATQKINYGLGYDFKNNAVMGKVLFRIKKDKPRNDKKN